MGPTTCGSHETRCWDNNHSVWCEPLGVGFCIVNLTYREIYSYHFEIQALFAGMGVQSVRTKTGRYEFSDLWAAVLNRGGRANRKGWQEWKLHRRIEATCGVEGLGCWR